MTEPASAGAPEGGDAVPVGACSAGALLARARAAAGLSVDEVAERIKLTVRQIEAIEADDARGLPPPLFTRGFLRSYARCVGEDAGRVLALYDAQSPQAAEVRAMPPRRESADIPMPGAGSESRGWYALAGVAALAVAVLAFYDTLVPAVGTAIERVVAVGPGREATAPPPAGGTGVPAGPTGPVPITVAGLSSAEGRASDATPSDAPRAAAGIAAAAPPDPAQKTLRLEFEQESWVEIRDRQGRPLLSQLNPAGSSREVRGEPPFSAVIGNAQHVRVSVNDRTVDLGPHTKVAVARLTLE